MPAEWAALEQIPLCPICYLLSWQSRVIWTETAVESTLRTVWLFNGFPLKASGRKLRGYFYRPWVQQWCLIYKVMDVSICFIRILIMKTWELRSWSMEKLLMFDPEYLNLNPQHTSEKNLGRWHMLIVPIGGWDRRIPGFHWLRTNKQTNKQTVKSSFSENLYFKK